MNLERKLDELKDKYIHSPEERNTVDELDNGRN